MWPESMRHAPESQTNPQTSLQTFGFSVTLMAILPSAGLLSHSSPALPDPSFSFILGTHIGKCLFPLRNNFWRHLPPPLELKVGSF